MLKFKRVSINLPLMKAYADESAMKAQTRISFSLLAICKPFSINPLSSFTRDRKCSTLADFD